GPREQALLESVAVRGERRPAVGRQSCVQLPTLQSQLAAARREAATLAQVEAQHAELQPIVGRSREDAAAKRTVNTQLKKEMFELRVRLDELESLSTCPTCKRHMDEKHKL